VYASRQTTGIFTVAEQLGFFAGGSTLPPGFKYEPSLLTVDEELALLEQVKVLPFKEFLFRGYVGKRRVVSYGWQYDFSTEVLRKTNDMPPFLLSLRETDGCAVVISHDRWFLDRIATRIFAVEGNSEVVWHEGSYQSHIEDLHKRKGAAADQLHRVAFKKVVRA
jgi:hypothetical protein